MQTSALTIDDIKDHFTRLKIGMEASHHHYVTSDDIKRFSRLTDDINPIHTDPKYAANTKFGRCIAHGMFVAGFIATTLSAKLPGPGCIYVSQDLQFKAPVYVNDTVETVVRITDINLQTRRVTLQTNCYTNKDTMVIDGTAVMQFPR